MKEVKNDFTNIESTNANSLEENKKYNGWWKDCLNEEERKSLLNKLVYFNDDEIIISKYGMKLYLIFKEIDGFRKGLQDAKDNISKSINMFI